MDKLRLLVTGANSMIGRQVIELAKDKYEVLPATHQAWDLTCPYETQAMFQMRPDYVIHLAGYNGGIEFNRMYPDEIFEKTVKMAINVLSCCRDFKVIKTLSVLASCSYPNNSSDLPMSEEQLWTGLPNASVECHGLAKRILDAYSRQLCKTGTPCYCAILNNSFGPFDRFDPLRGKVVSALIKRFVDAERNGLPEVICWGTGAPLREFIYCRDAAACLLQALDKYDEPGPINISSGDEISIKELTELIVELTGYNGKVVWDSSKPDGQMRKSLDITKMNRHIKHQFTDIKEALKETIEWYYENNQTK